jgi:hypothetical protein
MTPLRGSILHAETHVTRSEDGLSVATPEAWRTNLEFKSRYDGLMFDRALPPDRAMIRLLGVGHPLIDRALAESAAQQVYLGRVKGLERPFVISFVEDEVTGTDATVHRVVFGFEMTSNDSIVAIRDWETLFRLNNLQLSSDSSTEPSVSDINTIAKIIKELAVTISHLNVPFRRPKVTPALAFLPESKILAV